MTWLNSLLAAWLLCASAIADSLPATPADLDAYLAQRERREPGITPGTERSIAWASGTRHKTPLSVVYLHGYSATRQEVFPLAERVASALGANLFQTRLSGHGRDGAAMASGSVAAWQQDALEALHIGSMIGERVLLLSASTGGTLSTWLASQEQARSLGAMVMISPNFAARDRSLYVLEWPLLGPLLLHYLGERYRSWQPINELHARYWTWSYPYAALPELVRLMKSVEAIDKSTIEVPTLMVYSPRDQVIDADAVVETFESWGGAHKQLIAFELSTDPAQHVLAGDALSPETTEQMVELITAYVRALPRHPEP